MSALARFRVDPAKVRVGVRPRVGFFGWRAEVARRDGSHVVWRIGATPAEAVEAALDAADAADMQGVDLGMEWSYHHPWGRAS